MSLRIAPSILAADFARLADEVARVEAAGVDLLHVDVMDGLFVPNITVGIPVVEALKRVTRLPLDVHLMIERPDRYVADFVRAGAARVSVHAEAHPHLHRTLTHIRGLGAEAGVVINPSTPVDAVAEVLGEIDQLIVMSVNPGFTGQPFIPRSVEKVAAARALFDRAGCGADIAIDGGAEPANIGALVAAGVTVCIAGASIFRAPDAGQAVRALRQAAAAAIR